MINLVLSATAFFLFDRWTKKVAQQVKRRAWFGSLLRCRLVTSSKSLYQRNTIRCLLMLMWAGAFVSAVVLHSSGIWFQSPFAVTALGVALGGAAGNLMDILQHHYVVDFIDLRYWPVFNLADVGIVGGLAFAFWRG